MNPDSAGSECPPGSSATAASRAPLADWRVLVPRAADRAGELIDALETAGASGIPVPLISIAPPADAATLDLRLIDLAGGFFAWVGFTSVNAVDAVLDGAATLGLSPAVPADTRVAAVGPTTAAALRKAGLPVDLVPTAAGSGDALAAEWPPARAGEAVLLPRSDLAAPGLPRALTAKGYRVEEVTAYRTVIQPAPADVAFALAAGKFHAVLFTSPSTVRALDDIDIADGTVLGAIGAPTAAAVRATGRRVTFMADRPSAGALVAGLIEAARTQAAQHQHGQVPVTHIDPRRVEA